MKEASLSRVWQHYNNGDVPFAIISAFRGEYPLEENIRRNKALAAEIKKKGYGYFYVDGYWIENKDTPEERHVSEDSIFVIGVPGKEEEFKRFIVDEARKWEQEGGLLRLKDDIGVWDGNGNKIESFEKLSPGKLGDVYTKLKRKNEHAVFIFEKERLDVGFIGRLGKVNKK